MYLRDIMSTDIRTSMSNYLLFNIGKLISGLDRSPEPSRRAAGAPPGQSGSYFQKQKMTAAMRQRKAAKWFQWMGSPLKTKVTMRVKTVREMTS